MGGISIGRGGLEARGQEVKQYFASLPRATTLVRRKLLAKRAINGFLAASEKQQRLMWEAVRGYIRETNDWNELLDTNIKRKMLMTGDKEIRLVFIQALGKK